MHWERWRFDGHLTLIFVFAWLALRHYNLCGPCLVSYVEIYKVVSCCAVKNKSDGDLQTLKQKKRCILMKLLIISK